MASSSASFSDEFAQTARAEAARLAARAQEIRTRGERWVERGGDLLREADRLDQRVRELDELLGRAPQLRLDLQTRQLQGQALREEAARILLDQRGVRVAIHYREWFELVIAEGLTVAGKDPLATFLTSITRSPVIARVDAGQGVYQLDPQGAYERARSRLQQAMADGATADADESDVEGARRELEAVLEARTKLFSGRLSRTS